MSEKIYCIKLKCELEKLDKPPFPGNRGMYIWNNISKNAWEDWLKQQTILINEKRLNLADIKSRKYLKEQMEIFLFNETKE
ncbi:oxidative damage protection protein [Candidatus Kinetoplastidibacterium crithidiae]|uniref:Probable Fe(2+)-trafficking protein n=1 Tax=Candidatus Kinetoplastidibacterium crithidiae TCC036E TaxID=1208918 RepID=M1M5Q1_9PROT|nr:oxidative damage protection protein [Candidatus Kinetoplastibacterium crithidii]AFZ82475.1 Fe(II) trafficking protein YggX [Candidatus Kinetoplastibacterium crithidii (ex Angomonas deanei ATCC 30255)]AGF47485.1 Fe(II) trafficking protein [Candidatus Kinetoplastibacterium crithidii TCC036E]